jgi:tetratricopeptide (TPR) repeat protein
MTSVAVGISLLLQPGDLYIIGAFGQQATSTAAVSVNNPSPEARGDLLMFRREYQAAIAAYSSSPDQSAAILNKIGVAYHHLYALDKAKAAYEHALRLKPNFPDALNNLGAIFFQEGDFTKAEQLYRRALKLEPGKATAAQNLGAAYFAQGKLRKGTEAYRIALQSDPSAFSGHNNEDVVGKPATSKERSKQDYCLAALFAHAGMDDRAVEFLRKALDAGFDDYKRLSDDPDFANLRKSPEFAQLMSEERRQ